MTIEGKRKKILLRYILWIILAISTIVVATLYLSLNSNFSERQDFVARLIIFSGTAFGASLLASFVTAYVLKILEDKTINVNQDVIWLRNSEIKHVLEESIQKSETWRYRGSSGQYVMDCIADIAIEYASNQSRSFEIELYLHDIRSKDQLHVYLEYRKNTLNQSKDTKMLSVDFFSKVISSISRMAKIAKKYGNNVGCSVYLQNNLASIRVDMNSEFAVLTHADNKGAIQIHKHNPFYSFLKQETEALAASQDTMHLTKEVLRAFAQDAEDDAKICENIIEKLCLKDHHSALDEEFWRTVKSASAHLTRIPDNPYRGNGIF